MSDVSWRSDGSWDVFAHARADVLFVCVSEWLSVLLNRAAGRSVSIYRETTQFAKVDCVKTQCRTKLGACQRKRLARFDSLLPSVCLPRLEFPQRRRTRVISQSVSIVKENEQEKRRCNNRARLSTSTDDSFLSGRQGCAGNCLTPRFVG
jgi:hypothetical protein